MELHRGIFPPGLEKALTSTKTDLQSETAHSVFKTSGQSSNEVQA